MGLHGEGVVGQGDADTAKNVELTERFESGNERASRRKVQTNRIVERREHPYDALPPCGHR